MSYSADDLAKNFIEVQIGKNKIGYVVARPHPGYGWQKIKQRIVDAWDVLCGRADAVWFWFQ